VKSEVDAEDGLDDLFGDVDGEDSGSDSEDDSDASDVSEHVSRKPSRAGGAACDMGDGVTFHDGRLVVEVSRVDAFCSGGGVFTLPAGARWHCRAQP
jgi:hypothetical protein